MAIDYDPFCAVCGAPFSHVEPLDFSQLGEEEEHLKETSYNTQVLSLTQCAYISQFRIVARTTDAGTKSGINYTLEPDIFISNQGEWLFDEEWEMEAPYWVDTNSKLEIERERNKARYENFFPIHSVCVDLLQLFARHQSRFRSSYRSNAIKDFVDSCVACQKFSKEEYGRIWSRNQRSTRPPDYNRYGCVEWSHLYLGARRFWTDPWDCEPGQEYLCSNPTSEVQIDQFIMQCLGCSKLTSHHLFPPSFKQLLKDSPHGKSPLMRCSSGILRIIASHLPLRSAINLQASSRQLSWLINPCEDEFWRFHTLRIHGPWFWELWDHSRLLNGYSFSGNWEEMLKMLTASRRKLLQGAEPYWHDLSVNAKNETTIDSDQNSDTETFILPPGLQNRQRIWMCLEFINVDEKLEKGESDETSRSNFSLT